MQRPYIYFWKILGVDPLLLKKTFSAKPCFSSLDARRTVKFNKKDINLFMLIPYFKQSKLLL